MGKKEVTRRPEKCPQCGDEIVAVEYWYGSPERYDGISEYACVDHKTCGYRVGRWSGKVIPPGYVESRLGRKGVVPISTSRGRA